MSDRPWTSSVTVPAPTALIVACTEIELEPTWPTSVSSSSSIVPFAIETSVETTAPGAGAVVEPAAGGESCARLRPNRFGIAIRLWLLERTRVVPTRLTTTPRIRAWLARPMTVAPPPVSVSREPSAARA